jgi:hypothetical protein
VERKFAKADGMDATRSPGVFLVEVSDEIQRMDIVFIHPCVLFVAIALP